MTPDDAALASVLRKLLAADSFVAVDAHDRSRGPVRFTLDDTSVEITPREELALREVTDW